jgi:AcrR family transcriptional regulator
MKHRTQPTQKRPGKEARQKDILNAAGTLFSEQGFDVSTRQIAQKCGITQAALYKHFPSKDAIISAVFHSFFLDGDKSYFSDALSRADLSTWEKIAAAYTVFFQRIEKVKQRLFILAAMHNYDLPRSFGAPLDHEILEPVIGQLRSELGLSPLDAAPMNLKERELALMLHSTVVFLALRLNIYGIERLREDHAWIIEQSVKTWYIGALETMKDIAPV